MQFFAEKSQNRTPREVPHQYLPLTRLFSLRKSPLVRFPVVGVKMSKSQLFSRGIFFFSKYHVGVLKRVFHYVTRKRFLVENFLSATFLIS